MENVKNSALKIAIGNVEKTTFYIPIYDKTQFILQSRLREFQKKPIFI